MTAELAPESKRRQTNVLVDELQMLRLQAGNPTLTAMSHKMQLSRSSLSDTFTGKRRPSDNTLHRLADYFGVDVLDLLRLRTEAEAASDAPAAAETVAGAPASGGPLVAADAQLAPAAPVPGPSAPAVLPGEEPAAPVRRASAARRFRIRALVTVAVICLLVAATGLLVDSQVPDHGLVTVSGAAPDRLLEPRDGINPVMTRCTSDAVELASEERLESTVMIVLKHSSSCHAAWTEIVRLDGDAAGEFLRAQIVDPDDRTRAQQLTVEGRDVVHSPLLTVDPSKDTVCGIGVASISGSPRVLWPAVCSDGSSTAASGIGFGQGDWTVKN